MAIANGGNNMDKNEALKILETAKDKNGEVPMRLVRQAFEKLPEPCEDTINRQAAIDALGEKPLAWTESENELGMQNQWQSDIDALKALPSAQPEEVIPHRNYKHLSDYWCECGWHLGKKGEVKYCAECGRKVNWDG